MADVSNMLLAKKTLKRARISCDGFRKGLEEVMNNGWNPEFHLDLLDQMIEAMEKFIKCSLEVLALCDDDFGEDGEKDIDNNYKAMEENRKMVNEFKAYRAGYNNGKNDEVQPIEKSEPFCENLSAIKKHTDNNVKLLTEKLGINKVINLNDDHDLKSKLMESKTIAGIEVLDIKNETSEKKSSLFCSFCEHPFNLRSKYTKHKEICNDTRKFKCDSCDKEVVGKKALRNHMMSHQTSQCNLCGLSFPMNKRQFHKVQCSAHQEINIYPCDVCSYETKYESYLRRHESIHYKINVKKETSCKLCGKTFNMKYNLNKHLRSVHKLITKTKKNILLQCDHCEYSSMRKYDFKKHIERKHLKVKSPKKRKCDHCDYYAEKKNIKKHMAKDICRQRLERNKIKKELQNVKPICQFCKKLFKLHSYVDIHEKKCTMGPNRVKERKQPVQFSKNKEKPFQCNMCQNFFKTEEFLEIHMENHFEFELKYEKLS